MQERLATPAFLSILVEIESSELQKTHLNLVSRPSRYCGVSDLFVVALATVAYLLGALRLGGALAFALIFVRLRSYYLRHLRSGIPFLRVLWCLSRCYLGYENKKSSRQLLHVCAARATKTPTPKASSTDRHAAGGSTLIDWGPVVMVQEACESDSPASSTRVIDRGGVGHWVSRC